MVCCDGLWFGVVCCDDCDALWFAVMTVMVQVKQEGLDNRPGV